MARNPVDEPIHQLLQERWSPYAFDPDRAVAGSDLDALFCAARWAASSYNAQPWRYIVGVKGQSDEVWRQIHDEVLLEGNQAWTANAPVLALGVIETRFEHNGKPNAAAEHDLGAAAAQLTLEATARGLVVHQMIGLDGPKGHSLFGLEESQKVLTGLAIGYAGRPDALPEDIAKRDDKERSRKPLNEVLLRGGWSA